MSGDAGPGGRWGAGPATSGRELRSLVPQLVRAFAAFDTFSANRLLDEVLSVRTVEGHRRVVLRKMGVSSVAHLACAVARLDRASAPRTTQ